MASLPSIPQVAGAQLGAYESFWKQVDGSGSGRVDGAAAARFLKTSGLKENVLHQIWNLSDCYGRGFLDKQGFVMALKFVALAQAGMALTTANLSLPTALPVLTEFRDAGSLDWTIGTADKQKYDGIFQNLGPVAGKLSGAVVQQVMRNSKLPDDSLSKIWDMSDIDQDGQMDSDEFAIAMHLIYKALDGQQIPSSLPRSLIPPSKGWKLKKNSLPTSSPSVSTSSLQHVSGQSSRQTSKSPSPVGVSKSGSATQISPPVAWVVSSADKTRFDAYFNRDKAADGYISGDDARKVFLQSGLPNAVLGKIWELCDIEQSGKLNSEEFALAMHLISEALKGVDPPAVLTATMMPPSRRHLKTDSASSGADPSMMKELDQLSRDIEELGREKVSLDDELQKREESVRQKSAEVKALQVELDTSSSNLKDLENLKSVSKSRVEQMDEERAKYEEMVADVKQKCKDEEDQIARLKAQLANQDVSAKAQEEELTKAQDELRSLQNDKKQLLQEIEAGKAQLDSVISQINATQTEMTQIRSQLAELHSTQRNITAALAQYSSLAGGSAGQPLPSDLTKLTEPVDDALSARATAGSSPVSTLSAFSNGSMADKDADRTDDFKDDPFKTTTEQFGVADDPFNSDPFKRGDSGFSDPFGGDPFKSDPFKSDDPFQATQTTTKVTLPSSVASSRDFSDFDPFTSLPSKSKTTESPSSDPFAIFGTASAASSEGQPPKLPPKRSVGGASRQVTTGAAVDMFSSSFGTTQAGKKSSNFDSDPFGGVGGFGSGSGFADFGTFPSSSSQSNTGSEAAAFGMSSQVDKSPSDDDMLAWVKAESYREEQERQRQQKQVEAEEEQQFRLALQESVRTSSNA